MTLRTDKRRRACARLRRCARRRGFGSNGSIESGTADRRTPDDEIVPTGKSDL
jgi:hypothetical protein